MDTDNLDHVRQAQTPQSHLDNKVDHLKEAKQNQQCFTTSLFWRDVREVGIGIVMIPIWLYLGIHLSLPWTWYLTVPSLIWIAGFMLTDRIRQKRKYPESGEQIRPLLESSLAQVQHQVWLLHNVHWWYLLPLCLSMLAFLGQIAWQDRDGGLLTLLGLSMTAAIMAMVFVVVYWVNQHAIRSDLIPRCRDLEAHLQQLSTDVCKGQ